MSDQQGGDSQHPGRKLSLKAIAEQAVQRSREAQESQQAQQTQQAASSPPAAPAPAVHPATPAPAPSPAATTPRGNRLVAGALIALISAALSGGFAWWIAQSNNKQTPTASAPPLVETVHAPNEPALAPSAANAPTAAQSAPSVPAPAVSMAALPVAPAAATATAEPSATTASAPGPGATASLKPHAQGIDSHSSNTAIATTHSATAPAAPPANTTAEPDNNSAAQATPPTTAPLTPSMGAVQAAVGSVLGYARSCVAGDTEASRARVTFAPSGQVSSVSVTGPAAGTPAEGCIKAALSKARVAPFQKDSYSVDTAVRP
ncbi:MAG TPA: hypothetical protein VL137_15950 [Polyangiaceae bacterium]|nr:hypothetical protein [Polyangiaceae bacterium]